MKLNSTQLDNKYNKNSNCSILSMWVIKKWEKKTKLSHSCLLASCNNLFWFWILTQYNNCDL